MISDCINLLLFFGVLGGIRRPGRRIWRVWSFPNMDRRAGGLLSISFFIISYTKQFTTRFSTFTCGDFGTDYGGVLFVFLVVDSTHFCGGKGIRGVAVYGSVDYADFMEGCDCGCHGGSHEGSMHATPTPGRTADPGSCDDESRGLKTSRKTPHHAFSRTDLLADVPIWSYFAANCFGRWSSSVAYGTEASFLVKDH